MNKLNRGLLIEDISDSLFFMQVEGRIMIKIEEGKFYFLKDSFFERMKDSNLAQNKDNGNKRLCYYCFRDKRVRK